MNVLKWDLRNVITTLYCCCCLQEDTKWSKLRETYIKDTYHGYSNGNFTDEELVEPAKLIMDFTKALDQAKGLVQTTLEVGMDIYFFLYTINQ